MTNDVHMIVATQHDVWVLYHGLEIIDVRSLGYVEFGDMKNYVA